MQEIKDINKEVWVSGLNRVSAKDVRVTPPKVRILLPPQYKNVEMELKEYIDLTYNNFKDKQSYYDDLTNAELTNVILMKSKNYINELLYANKKNVDIKRDKIIEEIFKNIGILVKINDINLAE